MATEKEFRDALKKSGVDMRKKYEYGSPESQIQGTERGRRFMKKHAKSEALKKKREIKHHGEYSSGLSEAAKRAMRGSTLETE